MKLRIANAGIARTRMHAALPLASNWRIEPVLIPPPIEVAGFVRKEKCIEQDFTKLKEASAGIARTHVHAAQPLANLRSASLASISNQFSSLLH